ncbi:MAG: hypothetical protein JWO72_1246 [Caulobacteraceae bacterium]|nr:hypothetical protein [Caulobacteraceae bacterium]
MHLTTDTGLRLGRALLAGGVIALAAASLAMAQSSIIPGQARATGQTPPPGPPEASDDSGWPKLGLSTVASLEYAGMGAPNGPTRGPDVNFRLDSTFLAEFTDTLSVDGLFQVKSRSPLSSQDPNRELFINQGAGRNEGGKMKELYVRYGDYRIGKFVQDFGRAYAFLATPFAADFIEEPEQGYEPADMIGVERIHVFGNENGGWRQLSVSAFMVDRTFLHQSLGYNEGMIHLQAGGVGNTRYPENLMVTYDVINKPVGRWGQLTYQASVIRYGKSYGAQRGELWSTLGGDLSIPIHGSVEDTLRGHYSQLRLYVEGARRDNFNGIAGRTRNYLSGSAEYMDGPLVFTLTTSQRWTTDRIEPLLKDELYTASIGYTLPSQTVAAISVGQERVADRQGVYAGVRFTQTLTTCSRCLAKGRYY